MTIYEYTALKNPRGAADVVYSYGIKPHRDRRELANQLAFCVRSHGEKALDKVAKVHPDFALFKRDIDAYKLKLKSEDKSNACGCSNFSNANGQQMKNEVEKLNGAIGNNRDTLLVGGIIILGLALILKK